MFNGKRLSGWMALAVFATVGGAMVAADPAFAKTDVDKLTIGGEIRERYEIRTNASLFQNIAGTQVKSNESVGSHRVRVNVGYDLTPDVTFFAQIQDARFFGGEGGSGIGGGIQTVSSANQTNTGLDLHQGYIQLKNVLTPSLSLKIGRQEIIFGDHRLFGNFGWSQIGNSFDAVRLTHSTNAVDVDLFWARIVDTEAAAGIAGVSGSGNGVTFPLAGSGATRDQDIWGAYVTLKPTKNWTIEPYWFLLQDSRSALTNSGITTNLTTVCAAGAGTQCLDALNAVNGFLGNGANGPIALVAAQAPAQTRNTLGGRINGKQAGLDFTAEGAWQFGSIASRCTRGLGCTAASGAYLFQGSRDLHINAHAEAVKIGYTFDAVPMKPRLGFEFDYASGDGDNNKAGGADFGNYNTFDNLFPTNHFHYGYMDMMAWRNMVNYHIMFDVKPSPVSKLQVNFIIHRLADAQDNWYRAGQAVYATSRPTNTTASLGQELNLHYWHTFKEKFKFEIGYGHFFAGAYLDNSLNSSSDGGNGGAFPQGASAINGTAIAAGTQGTVQDQNWGYVMGSIQF